MARKIIFGILVALVIIFVAQNTQVVQVRFLVWEKSIPSALMLLGTFLTGVIITLLLKIPRRKK